MSNGEKQYKHRISDTTKLEETKERRVVLRKTETGLLTMEMDLDTLKELGLPVVVTGHRRLGDIKVSIENGPLWDQNGKRPRGMYEDLD